ncbi:MAG: hypothetical protein IT481_08465 [Gammaproteobacteria bacterium]|nr:hypothetical protein [Gammaproteobacteria bacterium]
MADWSELAQRLREVEAYERMRVRRLEALAEVLRQCGHDPAYRPPQLRQRLAALGEIRTLLEDLAAGRAQLTTLAVP